MPDDEEGQRFPNSGASTRTHTFEADDEEGEDLAVAIINDTAYTFRVWAVNAVNAENAVPSEKGVNNKSDEVTVTPSAKPGTGRTFDISATIDGKSWAVEGTRNPIQVVVTVKPAFAAPATDLYVRVNNDGKTVTFGPGDTTRSESIPTTLQAGANLVALFPDADSTADEQALKVTEVYGRGANDTPDTPANLRATAGDGYVTLSWTASTEVPGDRYEYRQMAGTGSSMGAGHVSLTWSRTGSPGRIASPASPTGRPTPSRCGP